MPMSKDDALYKPKTTVLMHGNERHMCAMFSLQYTEHYKNDTHVCPMEE